MRVLELPLYVYRGGCDDKIKYFLPMFCHSFLPKQTMQGCSIIGVFEDLPCSKEMFGREMRQRLCGEGKKLHSS